jgi:hypothetical protein
MIRFVLSLAFSLAVLFSFAQNLVPNPSFEEYLECPFSTAELHYQLVDWYSWQESPDFFHVCSNDLNGFAGVPENAWGNQAPISGVAYAGLAIYLDYFENGREYMATPLNEPLEIGQEYYMMFHTSLCDDGFSSLSRCGASNIGMRFFKDPEYTAFPPDANPLEPDNFAHLNYSQVLVDSENWTLVSGWFTADDAYNWVAIGNFFNDDQTDFEVLNTTDACSAVYYIENVCVALSAEECDYLMTIDSGEKSEGIGIYPNPASSVVQLDLPKNQRYNLNIFSTQGQLIYSMNHIISGHRFDVSSFNKGVYVLRFDSNSSYNTLKLVIQ